MSGPDGLTMLTGLAVSGFLGSAVGGGAALNAATPAEQSTPIPNPTHSRTPHEAALARVMSDPNSNLWSSEFFSQRVREAEAKEIELRQQRVEAIKKINEDTKKTERDTIQEAVNDGFRRGSVAGLLAIPALGGGLVAAGEYSHSRREKNRRREKAAAGNAAPENAEAEKGTGTGRG
jgi:hypothetical protein